MTQTHSYYNNETKEKASPSTLVRLINELRDQLAIANARIDQLEQENREMGDKHEEWVQRDDLLCRALRNGKISPANFKLYHALVDTYPQILTGKWVDIQVHEVRYNAGGISERQSTNFLSDLVAIGAIEYDAGSYDFKKNERQGRIRAILDVFLYPENFGMSETERAEKARKKEEERRKKEADKLREELRKQILTERCEVCSSENIEYSLTPTCRDCHHIHATVEHVEGKLLDIKVDLPEDGKKKKSQVQGAPDDGFDAEMDEVVMADTVNNRTTSREVCFFCDEAGREFEGWLWSPYDGEYICASQSCLSPESSSQRNREIVAKEKNFGKI